MHQQNSKKLLNQNIIVKEQEKIDKYQDFQIELGKLWKLKTEVVPVVGFFFFYHNSHYTDI